MKKISYSIVIVVIAGVLISGVWVYDRYFKKKDQGVLSFVVEKGPIEEVVKVRGEAVSQKEFDLQFPRSGIVEKVFVNEGQLRGFGAPLMKLETTDLELEKNRLFATLTQAQASLKKLIVGATEEDINISKTKVDNKKIALLDAKKNLVNKLQDVYSKSDDSIRNKADQLFDNPRSPNPNINVTVSDSRLKNDLESRRLSLENLLKSWKISLGSISVASDLSVERISASRKLEGIREFLDRMALLVNSLSADSSVSQATIDGYRSDIWIARTNINTAISNLTASEEKLTTAQSNLTLAEQELTLKVTGARDEDIEIARAKIREIESTVAIIKEKIRKSTLNSPGTVKIEKIWIEKGELFRPGSTAISLSTSGIKIQADVSELEIGKIQKINNNDVSLEFDAFPRKIFIGKVVSIEPRKVVKDGDTYYKINVYLDTTEGAIRAGMSADLTIKILSVKNVVKISQIAVFKKGNNDFVIVKEGEKQVDRQVETGVSDGEYIEIKSGLSEGETIIIPTN